MSLHTIDPNTLLHADTTATTPSPNSLQMFSDQLHPFTLRIRDPKVRDAYIMDKKDKVASMGLYLVALRTFFAIWMFIYYTYYDTEPHKI
jgi:hypothetical protein